MNYPEIVETFAGHVDWRRVKAELVIAGYLDTYQGPGLVGARPQLLRHNGRPAIFAEGFRAWQMAAHGAIMIRYIGEDHDTPLSPVQWLAGNPEEINYGDE